MDQERTRVGNFTAPRDEWKWTTQSMGHNEGSHMREFIALIAYIKNFERFQINKLTMQLKALEKQE